MGTDQSRAAGGGLNDMDPPAAQPNREEPRPRPRAAAKEGKSRARAHILRPGEAGQQTRTAAWSAFCGPCVSPCLLRRLFRHPTLLANGLPARLRLARA